MNIELYNYTFFSEKGQKMFTSNTYKISTSVDEVSFKPRLPSPMPSTKELFQESGNDVPAIEAWNTENSYHILSHTFIHYIINYFLINTHRRTTSNSDGIQSKSKFHLHKKLTQTTGKTIKCGVSSSQSILHIQIIVINPVSGGLAGTNTIDAMIQVPLYSAKESSFDQISHHAAINMFNGKPL